MSSSVIEGFPLSPQQRRLWRLGLEGRCRLRLWGTLEVTTLRAVLDGLVARHEILRTRFAAVAGMVYPVQDIGPAVPVPLEILDLRELSARESEAEIQRRDKDLSGSTEGEGVTLRGLLFHLSSGEHVLSLTVPALCADLVALRNLAGEIAEAYAAHSAGLPCADEPPAQYADLAEFFNELVTSEESAEARAFWRHTDFELLNQHLPFDSPIDPPTDPLAEFAPRKVKSTVSQAMVTSARVLAANASVELPDLLLGLWMILLSRLCRPSLERKTRVLVGRSFAGRNYEGLEEAIGLFARHLPVQVEMDDLEPLSRCLRQVAASASASRQWQEYFDWETVVPAIAGEARRSATQFFPHGFEMRPRHGCLGGTPEGNLAAEDSPELVFELEEVDAHHDLFEVRLQVRWGQDGLEMEVAYDARRYDAVCAGRLADALTTLLQSATSSPNAVVGSLALLSPGERQRLLVDWNPPAAPRPFVPVHERFELQARRSPGRVAIEGPTRTWTYAELNRAAEGLAGVLMARGVGPEILVAVCLERTWEVLVALLGILKAGGAYLPLDPMSPPARLAAILEDAGAALVLTEPPCLEGVCLEGANILILSELIGGSGHPPGGAESRSQELSCEGLAYVLYTSGSSGQPKGVMISHGSLANYMEWVAETLLVEGEGMPLITRPSFDASLKQLFGPLLTGGRVSVLAPEVLDNPVSLLHRFAGNHPAENRSVEKTRERVRLNCVPSLWRVLVDALESELAPPPDARVVAYVGGEALGEDLLRRSFEVFEELEMWNLYGPTEVTANASATRLRPSEAITLGRPIFNTRIYLLNAWLEPAVGGAVGEIFMAGAGLARGYCRQPAATAERFLPDLLGGIPGSRIYRSGDLARFRGDGGLHFVGRIDQQVKLRGYRIELEEIEGVLRRHPAVADTAAVVQTTAAGEARLLTFVVPRGQTLPDGRELAAFLAEELPEYMVPAYFLMWPELPRTAGGKVDRQELMAVDPNRYDMREPFVAPRGRVQEQLAEIWCRLLGQDQIGLKDNFYHRGGHSLIAIRMLSEIQGCFGVVLSLPVILESGSLEAMALAIDNACRELSE